MDVRLPDGTILTGVPEGTTRAQIEAKLGRKLTPEVEPTAPADWAATEMSIPERLGAGAVAGVKHLLRGVGQAVGLADQKDVDEAKKLEAPLMSTTAGKIGNFAGQVAALAPTALIPGANTLGGAALIGAGTGALTTEGGVKDRAISAGIGAAAAPAGLWLGRKIGGALNPTDEALTAAQRAAKTEGARLGLKLTPGQASGSKALQRVEAALESNPVTSGAFDALKDANQRKLTGIAAKAIGQQGDELSAPVLGQAFDDIGKVYNAVQTKTTVAVDPNAVTQKLLGIIDNYQGQYVGNGDVAGNALFKRISDFAQNGTATQEQLGTLASNLGKAAKNNLTSASGDRAMGRALLDTKEVVDDLLQQSLAPELAQQFGQARGQYRTLMQLTSRSNVVNPASGNVNPRALAATLQSGDKAGYLRGGNTSDLYQAARFFQANPSVVGDSGTATRSMGAADYVAALPARMALSLYLSNPSTQAITGATAANDVIRRALAEALTSRAVLPATLASTPAFSAYALQQ